MYVCMYIDIYLYTYIHNIMSNKYSKKMVKCHCILCFIASVDAQLKDGPVTEGVSGRVRTPNTSRQSRQLTLDRVQTLQFKTFLRVKNRSMCCLRGALSRFLLAGLNPEVDTALIKSRDDSEWHRFWCNVAFVFLHSSVNSVHMLVDQSTLIQHNLILFIGQLISALWF